MSVTFYVNRREVLNVANGNFARLMAFVGLEDERVTPDGLAGTFDGDGLVDLLARLTVALTAVDDDPGLDGGTPWAVAELPGHATVIECGLRPGYFTDRLTCLQQAAEEALATGQPLRYS